MTNTHTWVASTQASVSGFTSAIFVTQLSSRAVYSIQYGGMVAIL